MCVHRAARTHNPHSLPMDRNIRAGKRMSSDMHVAACFVGLIRTLPQLAEHLQQQVVRALGDKTDTFLSIEMNSCAAADERNKMRSVINVLKPKHATVFCNAIATLQTDWNDLPQSSFTVLPSNDIWRHLDSGAAAGRRCGVKLGSVRSFYGNQRKANYCYQSVVREEKTRGITYNLIANVRADLFLSKPLPAAAEIPRGHVTVPFCNPAHQSAIKPSCGSVERGDFLGRGRSECDVATDWMALIPRHFAQGYYTAFTTLTGNTSCADFARMHRDGCYCHSPMLVGAFQECMLSTHLHEHHVKYARGHFFGLIAASRGVKASTSGNPAEVTVTTNVAIATNGVNAADCIATHAAWCPQNCVHTGTGFVCTVIKD